MGMMPAVNWYGGNGLFPLTEYAKSRPATHFTGAYGGPYREDLIPWGWSSDCRNYYDMEFGKNFCPISYYSQRYNDGIPDWFRLHYFGTTELPAGGRPEDDPDSDGVDNLQEYLLGEDPTVPNPVYEPGFVWDGFTRALSPVDPKVQNHTVRVNLNPYPDRHGKLVHGFLYERDGRIRYANKWNNKGKIGWSLRDWSAFHVHLTKDQGIAMDLLRDTAGIYRFWSPVAGRLRYTCTVRGDAEVPVRFCIKKGSEELFAATCEPGRALNAELELQTALRDRIDFIVKATGEHGATVTLYPKIEKCRQRDSAVVGALAEVDGLQEDAPELALNYLQDYTFSIRP